MARVFQLARDRDWKADNPYSFYHGGVPLYVSGVDANRLADALQSALQSVVKLTPLTRRDIQHFVSDVLALINNQFLREGCFDIQAESYKRRVAITAVAGVPSVKAKPHERIKNCKY